jgi:hypothetical protein
MRNVPRHPESADSLGGRDQLDRGDGGVVGDTGAGAEGRDRREEAGDVVVG